MPCAKNAGARAHQSPRILLVRALPELRRVGAMRKLQHFHDASQAAQSPGMPLLRLDSADSKTVPEVSVQIRLFFWRRLGASGGAASPGISPRAACAGGARYR